MRTECSLIIDFTFGKNVRYFSCFRCREKTFNDFCLYELLKRYLPTYYWGIPQGRDIHQVSWKSGHEFVSYTYKS